MCAGSVGHLPLTKLRAPHLRRLGPGLSGTNSQGEKKACSLPSGLLCTAKGPRKSRLIPSRHPPGRSPPAGRDASCDKKSSLSLSFSLFSLSLSLSLSLCLSLSLPLSLSLSPSLSLSICPLSLFLPPLSVPLYPSLLFFSMKNTVIPRESFKL